MIKTAIFALTIAAFVSSMPVDVREEFANCAAPNGTDKNMHWWQCNNGPVQFLDAQPYDASGNNYEYPIHLGKPIMMKTKINNPKNTYTDPNLLNTINLWKYGGWGGCKWSSIPTLGLLKNLNACENGVPCPVKPGVQNLNVMVDFTKFEQIISLLKDNAPYQLEYILHDKVSGDEACMMVQAWAYLK